MSPKLDFLFSIIGTLSKMEYKFKNRVVLELPKKFIIVMTNPLAYYLIIKVGYTKRLLINKLILIYLKFEFSQKTNYIYDDSTKPKEKIRLD